MQDHRTAPAASGSTLTAEQTAYVRRLLFEELARTAGSFAEQANNASQAFEKGAGEGDDALTTAHSILGPVVDLLDTTGWDISSDGDLARDYERRFRGRDDES